MAKDTRKLNLKQLTADVKQWGKNLGFQQIGITKPELGMHALYLNRWLQKGYQADMHYMARHGSKRSVPDKLEPGTIRIISARMDYYPYDNKPIEQLNHLKNQPLANIATYALGKDYHKLIRKKLTQLAQQLQTVIGPIGYRAFSDSAPVMERAIANQAGLGWIGKNTMLINQQAGSLFFLGEIYTNVPLLEDSAASAHCGSCQRCIDICPTQAIVGPYQIDAGRCIAYLTIEYRGIIPKEFRPLIGNRIFGCDDCQLICPWNKFAKKSTEPKFQDLQHLNERTLFDLLMLSNEAYLQLTEGTVMRRPGYECWQRNIAIALGNSHMSKEIKFKLLKNRHHFTDFVNLHLDWALEQSIRQDSTSHK
ncbi:MAG: tRNA epoxyqueuosine(34) reductase QueG [Gammaproteobacteria bacterium RIFCSPHIGHO2_12_FULL_41_15]|nr:MAG: tRNA epoxyqueuosine(34) reductase QueG [Gammaproteobacteria bacterium RIFCSPHIGHO2_12_FULL_41_15]